MQEDINPDHAEEEVADELDDVIPMRGYRMVPVVGLGGSAGSIEALQEFFSAIGPDPVLAYVVVIHLSPDYKSSLAELIQRCTAMPVIQVSDEQKVEPGHVYVIPPGKALSAMNGSLKLDDLDAGHSRHVAVDIFFRTLADTHGAHAAGIVLSGMDGDGAIGVKRIKERGGLTIAQDPDEAQQDGMPRSAIATGMIDWVLPVHDMPARLQSYFQLESALKLPPDQEPSAEARAADAVDEAALRDVLAFLRTRTGRDFASYKRATIVRRIGRRMQVNDVESLAAYLNVLRTRSGEANALLQDLLITVTNFFRDPECFTALERLLPSIFAGKSSNDTIRVWVVACATGEEAYSVAMLLTEYARTLDAPPLIQVFATDLDDDSVRAAREGVYPMAIVADLTEERLKRFFVKEHRGYRVRRELREVVLFAAHDALRDSPFSRLDLVTCRNLLIYLNREAQARVFETFHFALLPQGKLFLGSSESVPDGSPLFSVVDKKHRIYQQRSAPRVSLPVPTGAGTLARALDARDGPVLAGRAFDQAQQRTSAGRAIPEPRNGSWADLHLRLLEQLAPPSILVDSEYDIVHLSPSAGRFLQYGGGEPSRNLLRTVDESLRIELRASLYQASQSRATVEARGVPLNLGGELAYVVIRVSPATSVSGDFFVITLEEQRIGKSEAAPAQESDPVARQLDRELERLKSNLSDTVEQYEASTEELKASNEELQAMNEELRSATEELETSREELQSINEELTTVNHELKGKVEELGHSNSDMHNLMDATAIATIFLDRELRITRFTPSAVSLFNLIPTDIGRPLTDLTSHLSYAALARDAAQVRDHLVPIEREVRQSDGSWHLARLLPYRTLDDRIAGVVLTFVNITERKRGEEALRASQEKMRLVIENIQDYAIFSTDLDRRINVWNAGAQRLLGYTEAEAVGRPMDIIFTPEDRKLGAAEQEAATALAVGRSGDDRFHLRKDGTRFVASGSLSVMRDAAGKAVGFVKILQDRSELRAALEALQGRKDR